MKEDESHWERRCDISYSLFASVFVYKNIE